MQKTRDAIEDHTNRFLKEHANEKATGIVYTIPVVVHVVYKSTTQNISDAQIQSQIDVLNNDFRLLNPDHTGTPALFAGLKSDAEINFCLAKQDPSGATSTGITRTSTATTSFSTNDAVKKTSTGGKDPWNTAKYLNIWVCSLSGGVLGYAQFPGGPSATDGVVITYTGFGTTGTATAPFNKGRTATHEVGHWLNLIHIWGDDGTGCSGTDNVADTPNQADENYGCPAYPTASCSNTSDMYMNYMDYTDDACMFMFSAGQVSRMRALFTTGGSRVGLLTSVGCNPVGATCNVPASLSAGSITQTSATLGWGAVSGATSYNVQLFTSGGSLISTNSSTTNSYPASGLSAGTSYLFSVQTVCATGSSAYSAQAGFTTSATATCGVPSGLASSAITTTTATLNWGAVSGAVTYNLQLFTSGGTLINTYSVASNSTGFTGLTAGTTYLFSVQTVCSASSSAYSSQASFTTSSGTVTYCASKGNSQADEWIDRVSLNGMVRTSASDAGYINTGSSASVTAGTAYSLGYSAGFSSTAYTEYWRVYIDWNQNGVFTDAGEQMVSRSSSSASNLSTTITVPATAKNGTTRMRVSMKYGAYGTSCETFTYGEVEDYNVVVIGGVARQSEGVTAANVESEATNSQFTVYPNPANTKIYLSQTEVALGAGTKIMMVDAQGRTWVNQTLTAPANELEKAEVNVENLPNGLYNLIITTGTGTVTKKLLVLHP